MSIANSSDTFMAKRVRCHDCRTSEGELHEFGCVNEKCPFCGGQLISCDCLEKHVDVSRCEDDGGDFYLPEIARKWEAILKKKGRIPFIYYPVLCAKCGAVSPEFFRVTDRVWKSYVQPDKQDKVLCRDCFDWIKATIDKARATRGKRKSPKRRK
jgi:hypothetical protein